MASASVVITGDSWTAITTANQSGFVIQRAGGTQVFVDHSTTGASGCAITKAIPLTFYESPEDKLTITADGASDVFYARCVSAQGSASLIVDVK